MLEYGKNDVQTPLAGTYNMHDSVSLGGDVVSLGNDDNSNVRTRNKNSNVQANDENSASANDKILEVFRSIFRSWCDGAMDQI